MSLLRIRVSELRKKFHADDLGAHSLQFSIKETNPEAQVIYTVGQNANQITHLELDLIS